MIRSTFIVLVATAALLGCSREDHSDRGSSTAGPVSTAPRTDATRSNPNPASTSPGQGTPMPGAPAETAPALTSADAMLTEQVRGALQKDTTLPDDARRVAIAASGGVVTLKGTLPTQAEKDAVQAKVAAISGVTRVNNEIEVKSSVPQ